MLLDGLWREARVLDVTFTPRSRSRLLALLGLGLQDRAQEPEDHPQESASDDVARGGIIPASAKRLAEVLRQGIGKERVILRQAEAHGCKQDGVQDPSNRSSH